MANQYFGCSLNTWVSGTTIYAQMRYYRTDGRTYTYQDTSFPNPTMTIDGTNFSDSGFGNWVRSGINVGDVYTTIFSKTVSANGTYGVSFSAGSGLRSDFAGTWYGSATVTEAYTDPSTPSVSLIAKTHNSASFSVSISSYGTPGGENGRWIEAGVAGQNAWQSPSLRSAIALNTKSATITVNNNSTQTTTLTIQGNTKYWYGGYATNTKRSKSTITGTFYTPCPPLAALSLSSQTCDNKNTVNAVILYARRSDGGAQTRTGYYRYSTDGGTTWTGWTSFGTVTNTAGTFTASVPTGSNVSLQAKLTTSSGGDSELETTTFTTITLAKSYVSVGGKSKTVRKLYCSVNGKSRQVLKLYASVNGKSKLVYRKQ